MDQDLTSHIILSEDDLLPGEQRLHLKLKSDPRLSLTLPYEIEFSIERGEDDHDKPVLFRWSPYSNGFSSSGFVLLHHTINGPEPIEIDHSNLVNLREDEVLVVNGYNHFLWELSRGDSVKFLVTLPEKYQKSLAPGEKYELLWPGSKITQWDWGTIREHMYQELTNQPEKESRLILLGGPHVSFTPEMESEPWPQRAEYEAREGFIMASVKEQQWRQAQQRSRAPQPEPNPGAPTLSVVLECSKILSRNTIFNVAVKVTYDAKATAKPIIFHTHVFDTSDKFQLYRRCDNDWEVCDNENGGDGGFLITDEDDIPVNVSQDDKFVSLRPGESWITSQRLQGERWSEIPEDTKDGETFRYAFEGATVDWWDWGSKNEHSETVVKLPCWLVGPVVEPADNAGRTKLAVPASDPVEFSVEGLGSDPRI